MIPSTYYENEMNDAEERSFRDQCAIAAMQVFGPKYEKHLSLAAHLSFDCAEALVKERKRRDSECTQK